MECQCRFFRAIQQTAPRLIHNRPGPVRCENAWYSSVTSSKALTAPLNAERRTPNAERRPSDRRRIALRETPLVPIRIDRRRSAGGVQLSDLRRVQVPANGAQILA
jgi:hypothetical protein